MSKKYLIIGLVIIAAVVIGLSFLNSGPGVYDEFSQCLIDSGAKMYGAWWCSHCAEQKKNFGKSWRIFQNGGYVECSTAQKTQLAICNNAGIESYPTWRFSDNTELTGRLEFSTLSQKTGCIP